ncbi:MAG: ATP-binding protein [Ignavibacteriales bacterium]
MIRKIIKINEGLCNGCGACARACHEGAIGMVNGKAKLLRDDYCDGLGDCLPACPTNAISFEEREAASYDQAAVNANKEQVNKPCANAGKIELKNVKRTEKFAYPVPSRLTQWPVQIKLVSVNAPYFENANLLIAADCTAYAYGNFHDEFIKNHITLIGCPKLDSGSYAGKLAEIFKTNNIKSITIVRMEVPCCGGIVYAVNEALKDCGKIIPCQVVTISTDGQILDE